MCMPSHLQPEAFVDAHVVLKAQIVAHQFVDALKQEDGKVGQCEREANPTSEEWHVCM